MRLLKILAVLAAAVLSQPAAAHLHFGDEICLTSYGTKRVNVVPTHYVRTSITLTFTATQTIYPTTTITPVTVVSTTVVKTTATTLPTQTDTFTSTATQTTVVTSFTTLVVTDTGTVTATTTTTPTLTVSTSAGFTPLASEPAVIAAGGATPQGSKRRARGARGALNKRGGNKACPPGRPQTYPQAVQCYIFVERVVEVTTTVTAHHTQTRTAHTSTSTTTLTTVTTLTDVPPDASTTLLTTTTITANTVATITTDTTTTTTTTSTLAAPTATYYPGCQSDNLIEYVGGKTLYHIELGTGSYNAVSAADAVTCCEICANTADCVGFSGPTAGFNDCFIFTSTTCNGAVSALEIVADGAGETDVDVVGNGNCGQIQIVFS